MRHVVLADDVRMALHAQGEGAPLVLLHAWGETHRSFDRLVALLPTDLHVIAPDQRGVGASDKPAAGYRPEAAAADVVGLLDAFDIPAAWMVGTSSGGYVAQQLAVDHPERLLGLVLIGAPLSLARLDPFGEILDGFHDPVTAEDVKALNRSLGVPTSIPRDFMAVQEAAALTIPRHVWVASYRGLVEASAPTEVGTIRVPTLIISGADDDLLDPADTSKLSASIQGSRHLVYDDTGHMVLWERPDWVARDIVAFVTQRSEAEPARPSAEGG